MPVDPVSIGIAILTSLLTKTADKATDRLADRIAKSIVPDRDPAAASEKLAAANQSLADALNRIKAGNPTADTQWSFIDSMIVKSKEKPDWLKRNEELLKQLDKPKYDFAQQLSTTLQPAIAQSEDARSILSQVGPEPSRPTAAQLFALPEIKKLEFPPEIKSLAWPQTTKFVWPESMKVKIPDLPSEFTFPGQQQQ
jgi:hypothetical protein